MAPDLYPILLVLLVLLCTLVCIRLFLLTKENRLLAEQLTRSTVELEKATRTSEQLNQQLEAERSFANRIQTAELKTDLQIPRLAAQSNPSVSTIPQKYTLVASMAEKGMSSEEIGAILSISTAEAKQLVTLAKIADSGSPSSSN